MGNEQSTTNGSRSDGVPFVCWQCSPKQPPVSPAEDIDANLHSQNSVQVTSTSFHFAEPSSYRYDRVPRVVTGTVVFTNPPKADGELRNKAALLGNIAVVERGGRVHFPDIVRRLLAVGVTGIVFIERVDNKHAIQSLFDGFHSSGRQSVSIPIVLLAKYHADQLLADKPSRVSIELLWREQACRYVVPDDVYFGVQTAARAGDMELLKHLLEIDTTGDVVNNIPKAVALCDAAENGHVDCIEILHSLGVSLDEQKPTGVSPLMMACSVGNVEAARALLMFGASLDLEDVHGMTALMVAARDGRAACVRLLVKKGARINLSRNRSRGTTALHIAARGGLEECCSILLQGGAEIETLSPNSTTALMEAARAGNLGCVKVLVDAGASLVAKDRDGNTAEHLARMTGHTDIEDFLREQAESESVKNHRRKIEETVAKANSTLRDLLKIAKSSQMSVDILYREMIREHKSSIWLEQPRIIYEVFHLLTVPVSSSESDPTEDPNYGKYTVQHFCSEVALWYSPKIFQKGYKPGGAGWTLSISDGFDVEVSSGYLKVLFNFVCTAEPLDDVLLVLFCKVVNHFIVNQSLGELMWRFLADEGSNSMLHHELTDVIRFVLLDPDQKRLPSSPLLNSLFIEGANILDFVIRAYEEHVQYKGHMTTIANSIFTLTNTPNCRSGSVAITCQDVVRQYTSQHQKWVKFEQTLAEQNRVEMLPLGERNAPLCHGCLKLKQSAVEYVSATLTNADVDEYTGYLETIFSGAASHYCKVTYTDEFITGFMYKKDKIHDHIPIPEPTRVSSFIQFPVPMPFHALTFTITFFGLCQVCDKLWYCDTLQSANWTNRMKWVIPTSVRKWYSFGVTEGPGSGAHGLQFSSKGYKNFIVLTDTWGRQEQWMHAIEDAIQSLATQMSRGNTESAMAIEIDNEVDAEEFDVMRMREMTAGASNVVTAAPKSDSGSRSSRLSAEEDENGARRRSNTMSSLESDTEPLSGDFREDDDFGSDTSSPSQELTMPTVRSRSSIELKYSGSGSSSGPRKTNGAGDSRRNLDLKRFQPDTQKFSEILDKLKIGSPPHVNNARSPLSASGSFAPFAQRNVVSPHSGMNSRSAAELVGMRHVVSTPDLTRMQG
ncbi:hypothetical protein KRP22_010748 [Phytophthora ramorum]|nr:Kinase D-interacting substrate of 220 kDa [Phytophthora ramorum]